MEFDVGSLEKRWRTPHNVCLVTTQSSNEGSLGSNNTETFEFAQSHISCVCTMFLKKPLIGEKLVAKRQFNNPMDKYAIKVVKGNEMVGQLLRKYSQIAWHFLARGENNQFQSDQL